MRTEGCRSQWVQFFRSKRRKARLLESYKLVTSHGVLLYNFPPSREAKLKNDYLLSVLKLSTAQRASNKEHLEKVRLTANTTRGLQQPIIKWRSLICNGLAKTALSHLQGISGHPGNREGPHRSRIPWPPCPAASAGPARSFPWWRCTSRTEKCNCRGSSASLISLPRLR